MPLFEPTPDHMLNWTTTEQVHPTMQYNGATCYYKYVDFGQLPNATTKAVAHGITGLDFVLSALLIPIDGSNVRRITAWISTATSSHALYIDNTNVNVIAQGNQSGSAASNCYLIYTKT